MITRDAKEKNVAPSKRKGLQTVMNTNEGNDPRSKCSCQWSSIVMNSDR